MRGIDFSSWQSLLTTIIGLAVFTLIGVGIRLVMMLTIQQRRERANRQINERLKTLMAAYKVLGGSFTGDLMVDPTHLRDLHRRKGAAAPAGQANGTVLDDEDGDGSDRTRRIRDAVEAALSDIILLGTEQHIRLAERAARELVAGRPVHTHELVVSLRAFIRSALDLDPIPADVEIPKQGPTRPGAANGRGSGGKGEGRDTSGNKGGDMAMGAGLGVGAGMGVGLGVGHLDEPGTEATSDSVQR
jgi:hypothetical protein